MFLLLACTLSAPLMAGRLKKAFDARGIEIPFPHLTVYAGVDKRGQAPPMPLNVVGWQERTAAAD